ncbi:MAG: type II toxin-antitoxin system VapC family toxin [Deltaproteobacteria bacterium]|nr:type II toxin-antitoxin system VapC family toxin [Deltaproteobacteria bacterium]
MIGLDTNILIRYLVADDKIQHEIASRFIEKQEEMFISLIVVCEMVWVLESCYKLKHDNIVQVVQKILGVRQFLFERSDLVWKALEEFSETKVDFSDCLIGWVNKQEACDYTVTFEKALKKLPTFRVLS